MIEKIGELIWKESPEAGVVVFAIVILVMIWILFYRRNK